MGVGRIGDAGRQLCVAPEIDQVERGLHREDQIEQEQRAQDRGCTQEFEELGRCWLVFDDRFGRTRGNLTPRPPPDMHERPHQRYRRDPEQNPFEADLRCSVAWVQLADPAFDDRVGRCEQDDEEAPEHQRNEPDGETAGDAGKTDHAHRVANEPERADHEQIAKRQGELLRAVESPGWSCATGQTRAPERQEPVKARWLLRLPAPGQRAGRGRRARPVSCRDRSRSRSPRRKRVRSRR